MFLLYDFIGTLILFRIYLGIKILNKYIRNSYMEVKFKHLNKVKEPSGTGNRVNRLHTELNYM